MASGQIRMTPDTMRERAGAYDQQAETVQNVIERMDALLAQLQEEWEGAAAEAYAEKFGELRPYFVDAKTLIDDIAAALRTTAQTVEDTDAGIAQAFRM